MENVRKTRVVDLDRRDERESFVKPQKTGEER